MTAFLANVFQYVLLPAAILAGLIWLALAG